MALAPVVVQLKFINLVSESGSSPLLKPSLLVITSKQAREVWISPMWNVYAVRPKESEVQELLRQFLKMWAALRESTHREVLSTIHHRNSLLAT